MRLVLSRISRRQMRRVGGPVRVAVLGSVVAVLSEAALSAAMVPLRDHLNESTIALLFVVPVVVGVALGGFVAGVVAVTVAFLLLDFLFIAPYYTLTVGTADDWVALLVYAVVTVLTARVVSHLDRARTEAQLRADVTRRLFELSELLVGEQPLGELLSNIVSTVLRAFDLKSAALLMPSEGRLQVIASVGEPLSESELRPVVAASWSPVSIGATAGPDGVQVVALSAAGRPVGILALRGAPETGTRQELLRTFANHLALALERGQLREQALRAQLLEESDRLLRSLVGAVSHDLRTPLAAIKAAASTLAEPTAILSAADAVELASLIDDQTDRLDRLVANLLDMSRIQAGSFQLRRGPVALIDLVPEALHALGRSVAADRLSCALPDDMPAVEVDAVLVVQVLANLIDNAARHSPSGSTITITGAARGGEAEVAVSDRGPGVDPGDRESIFLMFNRREAGGRAGLGLAIVKAFVEAHGGRVWVEDAPGGGARFVFSLPLVSAGEAV